MSEKVAHHIEISYEPRSERRYGGGALVLNAGHRARCSCGWWSDCYAQMSDTQRAIEVHLRRAERLDFKALIDRSSIGQGLADIKKRGIDAHLKDLELEMNRRRPSKKSKAKTKPEKLSVGDVVIRIPDGPRMCVENCATQNVGCLWFGINAQGDWTGPHRRKFRRDEIKKVPQ